jgi:HK97 family phage major capsid protein
MKKRPVPLDVFEESVLPALQQKHADIKALQTAIDESYDIFEEDAAGKRTSIKYSVTGNGETKTTEGDKAMDTKAIGELVATTVKETLKAFREENPAPKSPITQIDVKSSAIPEGIKLYKQVKSFTGTEEQRKYKAYQFGAWMLGSVFGQKKYRDWCEERGIKTMLAPQNDNSPTITIGKAHSEGVNTAGGVLVPDQIENDLIDLREMYGKFRANARIRPMVRDTAIIPRRTSGLTAYFPNEAGAITESTKGWDNVDLTAKKLAALAKYSSEVLEDAIISIADDLASEIVYAFGLKEDQCGFIGDGTSTYGGILGVTNALTTVWTSTSTTAAGSVIASGNAMTEVTDLDLMQVMGSLPEYADDGSAAWYCSRVAAFAIFGRLLRASGGVTAAEASGALPLAYGGYPIITTQVMPRTDTNSQVIAVFGSMKKAADFGDRRQTTISISDQAYWANDQVGIRGTERFDINVHDVGDGTNAGPLVALRAAAS